MNDYKRLTIREDNSIDTICKNCKRYNTPSCITPHACFEAIIERLAELEDKIENKTLIDLPCKVGDKLFIIAKLVNSGEWVLSNDYSVGDFIVTDIYLNINREPKFKINSYTIKLSDFGKTVFLTESEAQAKLKESKEKIKK